MNRHLFWRALFVVALIAGAAVLVATRPPRLGLDLKGGSQIVLQAEGNRGALVGDDAINRTLEVLRRRIDQLGVSEPNLQRSGDRRIIVELPGVLDPGKAVDVIGRTAQLEFRPVLGVGPPEESGVSTQSPTPPDNGEVFPDEDGATLRLGPSKLNGDAVKDATAVIEPQSGAWEVQVEFRRGGAERWTRLTGEAACAQPGDPKRRLAIVLDRDVVSSPQVSPEVACNEGITGGTTVITGGFSQDQAKDLALLIRAGALPVPVKIVEQRTIGPTLGEAAIKASVNAALIGASLTVVYMIAYYRLLGVLAALALLCYAVISLGVLLALNATLTLPGLAGFVLAIGMAVDANVLVFERIKEEHFATGKLSSATSKGFKKAWSAIADSNATTVLAAVLLFYLGSGAIRGFGVTLTVGVAVSMFTALVVTRLLVEAAVRLSPVRRSPGLLGITSGQRLRQRLKEARIDVIGLRRLWFTLSASAMIIAASGLIARGLNFGIEFTGGRLLEYSTTRAADVNRVRDELGRQGLARAVVQDSGQGNISIRIGRLNPNGEAQVGAAVEKVGGRADKVRDEFVGASIGNELRRKALIALGVALIAQLAYLAIRFRWNFGLSAVGAMFHDILILLGVFAWLGKQVDGVFLAALLTVVGYSINDSVVVFDRIREQRRSRWKEPLDVVANDACLQTIPRTINTGLGALFILVALYFLGGETLTDFALALLIGIVVGTYSSVFTAAPLCVFLDKLKPAPVIPSGKPSAEPSKETRKPQRQLQAPERGRR